ncbi:MAG: hypothetical protein IJA62_01035 [Ruminococcus sp.]|nr:hypothetical protein [Ruminococcus sp.]
MRIRIIILSFFILLLCGCKGKEPPVPVVEFSATAAVYTDYKLQSRNEFQARVTSAAQGVLSVILTSPAELAGLSCRWGDGFEMTYNDLCLKGEEAYLPDFSFQRVIYDVLKCVRRAECTGFAEGIATFQGRIPAGEYVAETDSAGYLKEIFVEEINLEIQFSYKE